ncbi:hypothetical protein [Sphingomonas sp.]|jgi:hypothetical protein|uniref:hypothetical protein n=1 Tax=Sphingomonas sp. TaxID=28214 RepID=UPI00260EA7F7|nr:hypothetical protein [Sphingomonas sp.]MDF2495478.1 hypothetical protein [Sphingomonas sp.]
MTKPSPSRRARLAAIVVGLMVAIWIVIFFGMNLSSKKTNDRTPDMLPPATRNG